MSERLRPRDIKDKVNSGEIIPAQAAELMRQYHEASPNGRLLGFAVGTPDDWEYVELHDLMLEWKKKIARPLFAAIGIVEGVISPATEAVGELSEDITFAITRTIKRGVDGVRRGLK